MYKALGLIIFGTLSFHSIFAQVKVQLERVGQVSEIPTDIANSGDERLFILRKDGVIEILDQEGRILPEPFLDISQQVKEEGSEQGLLGMVFHPDFETNGYFYLNYINVNGDTHLSRFEVDAMNPDKADPDSEFLVIKLEQTGEAHNGGDLNFGPDGMLYASFGDGSAPDFENNAQNPALLLGKIIRIDVDNEQPYKVPEDNPFVDNNEVRSEIWSMGWRNPWRFSFDRETGDMWISDVGQDSIEEINLEIQGHQGGLNYGWRCYEGPAGYRSWLCNDPDALTFPAFAYLHDRTVNGCAGSVTGGYVYRGQEYEVLKGKYFYADWCQKRIWMLESLPNDGWASTLVYEGPLKGITTFGENDKGELFVADYDGTIFKITTDQTSSIDQIPVVEQLKIISNPVKDKLMLRITSNKMLNADLYLFDTHGKIHRHQNIKVYQSANDYSIDIANLPASSYFLLLQAANVRIVKKMVKQ